MKINTALGGWPNGEWGPRPAFSRGPARVSLSPPRAAVLDLLAQQTTPCTVGALAASLRQHTNTVREHLDGLVEAGLVERTRAASRGRGRPAWLYAAVAGGPAARGAREYAGLATALAAQIARSAADPTADAVEAGRGWGRDLVRQADLPRAVSDRAAREEVVELFADLGFAPDVDEGNGVVHLRRCPLLEAAHRYPGVVCGVHLGMTQGAMEELGVDPGGATLEPFAERGACLLRLGAAAEAQG